MADGSNIARFAVKRRRARARYELGLEIGSGVETWRFELAAPATADDERVLTRAGARERSWLSAEGPEVDDGGPAIVWDRGGLIFEDDPEEGLRRGKLRFELFGFKLAGVFALGRNKGTWLGRGKGWRASKEWTLVMVPGQRPAPPRPPTSVLSGGSIDDPTNAGAAEALAAALAGSGATRRTVPRKPETAMRPAPGTRPPFSDPGWIFELRRGGVEVLAGRYRKRGELYDVCGERDPAALRRLFPELVDHLDALPVNRLLAHGEIAIDGDDQLPDAAELERRLGLDDDEAIAGAALRRPASLRLFDLLAAEGLDARDLDLARRKSLLAAVLPEAGAVRFADHIEGEGAALAERIAAAPGCSIAARRLGSSYVAGPSDALVDVEVTAVASVEPASTTAGQPAQRLTNRRKIFWPDDGLTKGDLLDYYREVAPVLLPHLADRPVVLARYPDGIYGRWFFQHHAPGAKSSFLRTVRIRTSRRPRDYFLIDDVAALLYLINMGTIPLHAWPCRVGNLDRPDWATIDIDRSNAGLDDVVALTLAVRDLCDEVELPTFVKTSGGTGMHVMIPLAGQLDWDQARMLAEVLARTVEARIPERATTQPSIADRGDRVYLDFMVNARGRLLIAPYSARAKPGATVSTPLEWSEIDAGFDPSVHTILTVPERMAARADPGAAMLEVEADIARSIALLNECSGTRR